MKNLKSFRKTHPLLKKFPSLVSALLRNSSFNKNKALPPPPPLLCSACCCPAGTEHKVQTRLSADVHTFLGQESDGALNPVSDRAQALFMEKV